MNLHLCDCCYHHQQYNTIAIYDKGNIISSDSNTIIYRYLCDDCFTGWMCQYCLNRVCFNNYKEINHLCQCRAKKCKKCNMSEYQINCGEYTSCKTCKYDDIIIKKKNDMCIILFNIQNKKKFIDLNITFE